MTSASHEYPAPSPYGWPPPPGTPPRAVEVAGSATGQRGATEIRARVVERVAAQAVREVAGATGTGRSVLGYTVSSPGAQTPATVRAHVDGSTAWLDVEMTVIYPAPVAGVTRRTREHLVERIDELTGLEVREVNITVVGMSIQRPPVPRVR